MSAARTLLTGRLSADWASGVEHEVEILDVTETAYHVRAIARTPLPPMPAFPKGGMLEPGTRATVPLAVVRDRCSRCAGANGGMPGNENVIDGKLLCDHCTHELMTREAQGVTA